MRSVFSTEKLMLWAASVVNMSCNSEWKMARASLCVLPAAVRAKSFK